MSADNWGTCPRCQTAEHDRWLARQRAVEEQYGKKPQVEYMEIVRAAEVGEAPCITLREDYEVGIRSDGIFEVSYRASCKCGFRFAFSHRQEPAP